MKALLSSICCAVLVTWMVPHAHAQQPSGPGRLSSIHANLPFGISDGYSWLGYTEGAGLGSPQSYFSAGGFAPRFVGNPYGLWFTQAEFHYTKTDNYMANIGMGRRLMVEGRMFGFSVWYDIDDDRPLDFGHIFQEVSLNFETRGPFVDFNFNYYLPVGTSRFQLGAAAGFLGNNIVINPAIDGAMRGFDTDITIPIPLLEHLDPHFTFGGYWFELDPATRTVGYTFGFDINTHRGLSSNVRINTDDMFGTTTVVQAQWYFHGSKRHSTGNELLMLPVVRKDHMVRFHEGSGFAVNPATGLPWNVIHVDNNNPNPGSGTFLDPFNTLLAAQANSGPNDLIYVRHDGTTLGMTFGIALQLNQLLLGAGINHNIPVIPSQGGTFTITPNSVGNPMITNAGGPAVGLDNGTTVSGFDIDDAATGIFGTGLVGDATIDRNAITTALGGVGIEILNSTGTYIVSATPLTGDFSPAVNITGGAPTVNYTSSITNTNGGNVIEIDGTTGGIVTFNSGTITDTDGQGILLNNVGGTVTVNSATIITDSTTTGIEINGGTGTFTFSPIAIDFAVGTGVDIDGGSATININLALSGLTNAAGLSVDIENMIGGSVTFTGGPVGDTGDGILIQNNNAGNPVITFSNQVNVTTGTDDAVEIFGNTGATITFSDLDITTTGFDGLVANNNDTLTISTGTVDSTDGVGVNIQNTATALNATFTTITVNNAAGAGVVLDTNVGTTNLGVLNLTTTNGIGLFASTAGTVNTNAASIINTTGDSAVDIDDTLLGMLFTTITATNTGGATGIDLDNLSAGSAFTVSGIATVDNAGAGNGILVSNTDDATIAFDSVIIANGAANGISLINNNPTAAAGPFAFSFTLGPTGSTFTDAGVAITNSNATIDNITFNYTGAAANAIQVNTSAGSNATVLITNNTIVDNANLAVGIDLNADATVLGTGVLNATITNNGIDVIGNAIDADVTATGTLNFLITGNDDSAGGNPLVDFDLNVAAGGFLGITQASTAILSTDNNTAVINTTGAISTSQAAPPTP